VTEEYKFYQVGETVNLIVPDWYRHETYLPHFRTLANGLDSFYVSKDVDLENYKYASHHLVAGSHLALSVIGIKTEKLIPISKCVKHLIENQAVLTNIHGLALAFEFHREIFLPGFGYYGLDTLDYLPKAELVVGNQKKVGHKHPAIRIPKSKTPQSSHLGNALTGKFGKLTRFLKFEQL
jgi:hypothetical protein